MNYLVNNLKRDPGGNAVPDKLESRGIIQSYSLAKSGVADRLPDYSSRAIGNWVFKNVVCKESPSGLVGV